jgi:hypothetical protein
MRISGRTVGLITVIVALFGAPAAAQAQTPNQDISSTGPLEHIYLGNELSCQVDLVGDEDLSFFPPTTIPGDCGTMLRVGDVSYTPNYVQHGSTATGAIPNDTPFTPVSQTPVTGTGTSADPFTVVTTVTAGTTGLTIVRTDTYVVGNRFYTSQVQISNTGAEPVDAILYHAGDCFLQESDDGFGFFDAGTGGIFCSLNPNNSPPGRLIGFVPISSGSNYMEDNFSTVWQSVNGTPFPNTVRPNDFIDNGAGLSWSITVPALGSVTRSFNTVIDITGGAPPVTPPATTPPASAPVTQQAQPKKKKKKRCKKGFVRKKGKCVKKQVKQQQEPGFTG